MIVIHLARKSLSESSVAANVLEHGTGGLNIEATRIDSPAICAILEGKLLVRNGRWPANLILEHRPTCRPSGTRQVPSGTAVRHRSGGKTIFSETDKPPMEDMTYADENGMETVEDWKCADDCPVADLDQQSGFQISGIAVQRHGGGRQIGTGRAYRGGCKSQPQPDVGFGDTGGASRFFKQVQDKPE